MTRDEFFDQITCWSDLLNFCYEHNLSNCENIRTDDERNASIDEELMSRIRSDHWTEVRDFLNSLEDNYPDEYWAYDEYYGDWRILSDGDFDNYMEDVARAAEDEGIFEPEEENEEYAEESEPEEEEPEDDYQESEPVTIEEILSLATDSIHCISVKKTKDEPDDEEEPDGDWLLDFDFAPSLSAPVEIAYDTSGQVIANNFAKAIENVITLNGDEILSPLAALYNTDLQ